MTWPLDTKPYAVQTLALERAGGRFGFGYLMEMGLGKTQTALAEAINLLREGKIEHMAVICPNTLKGVWAAEAEKTGAPFTVVVWDGVERPMPKGPALLILNYEATWQRGGDWLRAALLRHEVYLVADESVAMKDPRSRQTKACLKLGALARYKRILTGAPITQGPQDAWGQLSFLGAPLGSFYGFRGRYCRMGGFQAKKVLGAREDTAEEFSGLLDKWCFRATKDEWTDIPALIKTRRRLSMNPMQTRVYKDLMSEMFAEIEGGTVSPPIILTRMLRLQQVSSGFVTDDDGKIVELAKPTSNSKVQAILDILEETRGKALVFTMFRHTVTMLEKALADYKPALLVGGMDDLDAHKARFETDPECRVMIVQQQAGKYGHTLLGGGDCSTTIFAESSWSLDTRLQALARNHRHGQRNHVVVHDLPASDIEEKVLDVLNGKAVTAEQLVDAIKAMRQGKLV